ncbi:beta-propeller fold lactonase family protein [Candidatus Halobeggiatoa sp. HSG11]|nr:beta-propeller fold lactonase family protein [Candidatus Halobeggiatoa sp. HSG11]
MKWWKFLLLICISQVQAAEIINTVAGDGIQQFGGDNGNAINASLNQPSGVAIDKAGTLYIADTNNHRIRKIKDGHITTIAGNGNNGYRDGTQALLNHPTGITLDSNGNIYFADTNNHVIRKLDKQGNVTTIAGNNVQGSSGDNGPAIQAQLNTPTAIAIDYIGNLYIADTNNHRIRKVANGYITTLIGNGIAGMTLDQLNSPQGLAVDKYNLYIADTNNHRILRLDNTGYISVFAGNSTLGIGGDNGPAVLAQLNLPRGLAVAEDLYIADSGNHRIRKVTDGQITTIAGNGSTGFVGDGSLAKLSVLNTPTAIAVSNSNDIYIADTNNQRIRLITTYRRSVREGQILTINKSTFGLVTAEGLSCGDVCSASYTGDVTLTASPYSGASFKNWTGDCTGNSSVITITMDANKNCTANFIDFTNKQVQPNTVAISPDGKHVYATSFTNNSISTYVRNTGGTLTFINTLTDADIDTGLQGASTVAVSPNGRHVYVGSLEYIVIFTRNQVNGSLSLVEVKQDGINGIDGLAGIKSFAFSPDETRVYVVGYQDNSLSVFERDVNTGFLSFLDIQNQILTAPTDVAVNGNFIYVTSSDAITSFTRNPAQGEISFVETYPFDGGAGLAIVDSYLYAISYTDNSITAFNHNAGVIGNLQVYKNNVDDINGLGNTTDIVISPNGSRVFVTSYNDDAVAIFNRDIDTGLLSFQQAATTFDSANSIAIVPAGNFAYVATSNAVATLSTGVVDLQVKVNPPKSVAVSSNLNYVITVINNSSDTTTNVTLIDTLPANLVLSNSTASQGVCGMDGGKVKCTLGALGSNSVATVNLQVSTPETVTAPVLLNEVSVNSNEVDTDISNNTATVTTNFMLEVPEADLQLAVESAPQSIVGPNNQLVYELTVSNSGPEDANNITVTSTLPDNVTFDADKSDCSVTGTTVICNLSLLEVGTDKLFSIYVTTGEIIGPIEFTSNVVSNASDQDTSNNQVTKNNEIGNQEIDLMILDVVGNPVTTQLTVGSDITYTVQVQNNSTDTIATGVSLIANLPPQMTYIQKDNCGDAQPCICTFIGSQVSCSLTNINPSDSQNIDLTLRAIQTGLNVITNFTVTGDGTDTDPNNNSKSTSLEKTVGNVADYVVTVKGSADSILVGENVSYDIEVTNNGPDEVNALLQVNLVGDNIAVAVSDDSCSSGTSFNCTISTPVGEPKKITVDVISTQIGNISITANVVGNGFDSSIPNNATVQTAVSNKLADIGVDLKVEPVLAFLGKNVTYITTITNNGPNQATGIVVTQDLDPNVKFVSATPSQGPNCTFANHAVTCQIGPLSNSGDNEAIVNVVVVPQLLGTINSAVTVKSDMVDSDLANNTAQIEKKITQMVAKLELQASGFPSPVVKKNPLTYSIKLTNAGPYAATDIKLKANLPVEDVIFKSPAIITPFEVNGTCEDMNEAGEINCTIVSLPKDGTATVTVEVLPLIGGILTLTAEASAAESETVSATAETPVSRPASLFFLNQQVDGIAGVSNLQGPMDLVMTNDGEYIYVASFSSDSIVVFSSNNAEMTFVQSLVNGVVINDDASVTGLGNASSVSLSPDEKFLYVAGFKDNSVVVFQRNATDGTLSYQQTLSNEMEGIDGLAGALAVLAQEDYVYVAGAIDDAITIFQRDAETGLLTYQETIQFADSQRLDGINSISITEDEDYLFTTSANGNKLSVFRREEGGKLNYRNDNMPANGSVVIKDEYIYSINSSSLSVFKFFPKSGLLTVVETLDDDSVLVESSNKKVDGLADASDLTLSPDASYLYVTARSDNSIAVFKRDAETGKLTFVDVRKDGVDGLDGLSSARGVITSPAPGEYVYVAGFSDNSITTLSMAAADLDIEIEEIQSAQLNDSVTADITVINRGPQQAVDVIVETILPETARLISFNPNQGQCSANGNTIRCILETLELNERFTLPVVLSPTTINDLTVSTTATSGLFDSSPASSELIIPVIAQADLWLDVKTSSLTASIETKFQYNITLTNNGPDEAFGVILTGELPSSASYNSARVGDTVCDYTKETHSIDCVIGNIKAGISKLATLIVIPKQEDALLDNVVSVTSKSFDSDSANNRVMTSSQVLFNSISITVNNTGDNLHNYVVEPNGAIIGGSVSGIILNKGLLSNVQVKPDTIVSGGKLGGTISNDGILEDVQLLSDAIINGGTIRGKITGFPTAPAIINAAIANDSELEHVILGTNVELNTSIKLGNGVRFINENIPIGSDLTLTFPKIGDAIDLTADILPELNNLLEEINSIPNLQPFTQLATGQLFLEMATENLVLLPTFVSQVEASPTMTINDNGSVTFITPKGRQVIAQPSLQDSQALQAGLNKFGWDKFVVDSNGVITIDRQVKLRPNLYAQVINPTLPIGLDQSGSAMVLRFLGDNNKRYQQFLYPAAANQAELETTLQAFPGASEVSFYNDGRATVTIGSTIYSAQLDYKVKLGNDIESPTQLLIVSDKNSDGIEDVQMTYSNGDRQIMYFIPPTDISQPNKPLIQDINALEQALQEFGLSSLMVADNGDITIPVSESLSYVAAPALKSKTAWMLLPVGFHYILTRLPGVLNVSLVFQDEAGIKYQQDLYPTAKYPEQLEQFFMNMPGNESVTFNDNGTLLIIGNELRFKGIFDYSVVATNTPTGSIQVSYVADLNGDGISDFEVLYGTGEKQIVYQVPE